MTTATKTRTVQAVTSPAIPDMDTRLMLASIGMDVLLARVGRQALADAHAAVTAAIAQADRYSAEAAALSAQKAAQRPELFRSQPILQRAGDIIRARGWHQGSWTNEQGAVCALAAIRLAAEGNQGAEADAVAVLLDRIRDELGHGAYSVPGWNDSRRDRADVVRLLF